MDKGCFHLEKLNITVPRGAFGPEQNLVLPIPKAFEKEYRFLRIPLDDLVPFFHVQFSRKGKA